MAKIESVLTARVLRFLHDEHKARPEKYAIFFDEYERFLREGLLTDEKNNVCSLMISTYIYLFVYGKEEGNGMKRMFSIDCEGNRIADRFSLMYHLHLITMCETA